MKILSKVLNVISAILFFLSIIFLYGTCGSLDLNKITYQQGIERIVLGFLVVILAAALATFSLWLKFEVSNREINKKSETEVTRQPFTYYNNKF